ncbi:hypothetical protein HDU96_009482 [Phlyctochytrium bullatum]|nr:hypothetical protein HDU96_009482 [Phlyctochytrium bullatum]
MSSSNAGNTTGIRSGPVLMGGAAWIRRTLMFRVYGFQKVQLLLVTIRDFADIQEILERFFIRPAAHHHHQDPAASSHGFARVYGKLTSALTDRSPVLICSPFLTRGKGFSATAAEFYPVSSFERLLSETDNLGPCQFGFFFAKPVEGATKYPKRHPGQTYGRSDTARAMVFKTADTAEYKEWIRYLKKAMREAKKSVRVITPLPSNFPRPLPVFLSGGPDIDSDSDSISAQSVQVNIDEFRHRGPLQRSMGVPMRRLRSMPALKSNADFSAPDDDTCSVRSLCGSESLCALSDGTAADAMCEDRLPVQSLARPSRAIRVASTTVDSSATLLNASTVAAARSPTVLPPKLELHLPPPPPSLPSTSSVTSSSLLFDLMALSPST